MFSPFSFLLSTFAAWCLIHGSTLSLVRAERALCAELKLRAACAKVQRPSPHQGPGWKIVLVLVLVLVIAAFYVHF